MRAPFDPYGAASPAIDQQLGDAFQVVRFVARHIPEIASVAYHMEGLYKLVSAGGKSNADLLGLPAEAVNLGEFEGDLIPDDATVRAALQVIATYVEALKVRVDNQLTDMGSFTGTTIPDQVNLHDALQALETAIERVFPEAPVLSTEEQAKAGTDNTTVMSPLRVAQAVEEQVPNIALNGIGSEVVPDGSTVVEAISNVLDYIDLTKIRSIKELGAKGDGTTNDTAAFIAMAAAGGEWHIPDGTYLMDYVKGINKPLHVSMADGAVLKQRLPDNPATTLDPANNLYWGIFEFLPGSDGSSISGGVIDGNRDVLAPYYPATTRLGLDPHWWGIRAYYTADISVYGTKFRNIMQESFYALGCPRFRAIDVDIMDSGVAFAVQGNPLYDTRCVVTGRGKNIGNVVNGVGYYFFQHGAIFSGQHGGHLEFVMEDFCGTKPGTDGVATGGGKEPVPIAISSYDLSDSYWNVSVRNYTAPSALAGMQSAFDWSSVNRCHGAMKAIGFERGLSAGSSSDNTFDVYLDGEYKRRAGYPSALLYITFGGVFAVNSAGLAGETTSNLTSRNNVFRGTVTRGGIGVRDEGDNTDLSGISAIGNVTDGIQIVAPNGNASSYPTARNRYNGNRRVTGAFATANGNAGIIYTGGRNDRISDCTSKDNGQSVLGTAQPHNISVLADAGAGIDLKVCDNFCDDTPAIVDLGGASYAPGTTSAAPADTVYDSSLSLPYIYKVNMRNTNLFHVGQIITLVGAASGGVNATGKIVDISADPVTLAHSVPITYVEVLTTLTGTGATTGTVLTGTLTAFLAELDFKCFLKFGSEYREIAYVNSDGQAILASAFSTDMPAGTALQVVRANVNTRYVGSSYSVWVNENVTVGPFLLRDNQHKSTPMFLAYQSFPGLAEGSRWDADYSLNMTGTALVNNVVAGIPRNFQVEAVRSTFTTAITGTTGANEIQIRQGGVTLKTAISGFSSLASGTVAYGPTPDAPACTNSGGMEIAYVSSAGNPTGSITVRAHFRKVMQE